MGREYLGNHSKSTISHFKPTTIAPIAHGLFATTTSCALRFWKACLVCPTLALHDSCRPTALAGLHASIHLRNGSVFFQSPIALNRHLGYDGSSAWAIAKFHFHLTCACRCSKTSEFDGTEPLSGLQWQLGVGNPPSPFHLDTRLSKLSFRASPFVRLSPGSSTIPSVPRSSHSLTLSISPHQHQHHSLARICTP